MEVVSTTNLSSQTAAPKIAGPRLKTPKTGRKNSFSSGVRKLSNDNASTQSGSRLTMTRKVSATGLSEISESTAIDYKRAARTSQPTYQLRPMVNFNSSHLKRIVQDILELYLSDTSYDPDICAQKSKDIAKTVTDRVKRICLPRFKVVTIVNIGELKDFVSVNISSRNVWDEQTDKCTTVEYRNQSLYSLVMIYTLYTE